MHGRRTSTRRTAWSARKLPIRIASARSSGGFGRLNARDRSKRGLEFGGGSRGLDPPYGEPPSKQQSLGGLLRAVVDLQDVGNSFQVDAGAIGLGVEADVDHTVLMDIGDRNEESFVVGDEIYIPAATLTGIQKRGELFGRCKRVRSVRIFAGDDQRRIENVLALGDKPKGKFYLFHCPTHRSDSRLRTL